MNLSIEQNYRYSGRRSVVLAPTAAVASSQPLATQAGLEVLRAGGSAADAAVAVAAALQVTQPCSTGLGGDAFALYYDSSAGLSGSGPEAPPVFAYNGSGRAPAALTRELALEVAEEGELPNYHAHTVTVPGAADAWFAVHERFGRLAIAEVLQPAIRIAEAGFSVEPMTARWWKSGAERQLADRRFAAELTRDGRAPAVGERFRNPSLAAVLRELAREGRDAFYRGRVAEALVAEVRHEGGVMTLDDLQAHSGEWVDPISLSYAGHTVWECPPNGQGLAALLALGINERTRRRLGLQESTTADPVLLLHLQIEAMRLGFADAARFVADPATDPAPLGTLLSDGYLEDRSRLISAEHAMETPGPGLDVNTVGTDTVYFSVVDGEGNGCSFINSNFMGFGTGIVPEGCGFTLQNRGRGFTLRDGHPNSLAPGKRPYHTIIPGLLTNDQGALAAVFGVMGGMMQPQGHLQVLAHLLDAGLDPQSALDAPRFCLADGSPAGPVQVEESMDAEQIEALRGLGHEVDVVSGASRAIFGLGQVIVTGEEQMLWCGSDPRGDGHAGGF